MINQPAWGLSDFRIVFGSTQIEYDHNKEGVNREKHRYSLESAAHLFSNLLIFISQPFISRDVLINNEIRQEHLTVDDEGKIVFVVTTMRDNESVRIISFRRAERAERETFFAITGYVEK